MLLLTAQVLAAGIAYAAEQDGGVTAKILKSLVKVYAVSSDPSYLAPWAMLPENQVVGTGFVIRGQRILTSAHVVANQKSVSVRKALDSEQYPARVIVAAHDADLAVLAVDDEDFFGDRAALEIGEVPELPLNVEIAGFPDGEIPLITRGILSGLDYRKYCHSSTYLLAGEIRAGITTGFSGGPVMSGGTVVGVMMQASRNGTVANMVPSPVIEHILVDMRDGQYDGFPDLGVVTYKPDHAREEAGHEGSMGGIVVQHVITGSSAEGKVKEQDILLSISGYPVGSDGNITFRSGMRTDYRYPVEMKQMGDTISVQVFRDGAVRDVSFPLNKRKEDFLLIPNEAYDSRPSYFIFGGIVFSPLTRDVLNAWGEVPAGLGDDFPAWPAAERRQIVVALDVLPDKTGTQHADVRGWMISEVNGRPIGDFQEFFEAITGSSGRTIILQDQKGRQLLLDRAQAMDSNARILAAYGIKEDRSPDLMHGTIASSR
ncbi:MAG: trypsin-like peptidase domain-containing protein [Nitrospiraceae bacterium]|nr:MAG: trypsin-like peptidase domain-containing protein [Nitrospiraceae bacterium]